MCCSSKYVLATAWFLLAVSTTNLRHRTALLARLCDACREESDAKINPNLQEMKLRMFSTKVRLPRRRFDAPTCEVLGMERNALCVVSSLILCLLVMGPPYDPLLCVFALLQVHTVNTTVAYKQDDASKEDQAS